jgi:sugar/nucleoside kinase (ribokinase family)
VKPVVFLGDFNVDLIMDGLQGVPQPDHEISCSSFDIVMGASCCIAAAAYARLGGAAAVCGLAGTDDLGAFMCARLREAGVRIGLVTRDPDGKTGVTVNLVQERGRSQVTFPGAMGTFSAAHVPAGFFRRVRHLHISGIYQAASLLPDAAGLLARAKNAGATTSLDCQWDPTERWESLDAWLPRLDWLFVNQQEACSMTGEVEPGGALRALAARTRRPVVKAGPAGAWVLDGQTELHVPGHAVTVVDAIGAGDNFDAGFLFAVLEKRMDTPAAARFANAAAARSCTFRGGTASASTFRDVIRFMDETERR